MSDFHKYKATITRVVDGDTVDALVDLGFGIGIATRFRLTGFDAPETYRPENDNEKKAGEAATEALKIMLAMTDNKVIVHSDKRGKYRYLATIYSEAFSVSINQLMIMEGHIKND